MSASHGSLRTYTSCAVVLIALAGVGSLVYWRFGANRPPVATLEERATQKEAKGVRFKRPGDATLRGIAAQAVRSTQWRPQLYVDGRVVVNPRATLDIRAPFAGILRVEAVESKLRLGVTVDPRDTLAMFDARFTPAEGLDLKTKLVEAEARHKNAEALVKTRQASLERRQKLPVGLLSQDDVDLASVQLSEAQMQANVALMQWKIWKQALEAAGKKTVVVSIQSPMAGEITEIGVQPGTYVDAGQMIARVVDFRRVLVRLDFPTNTTSARPETLVHVMALDSEVRWCATRRGRAQSLEPGLQKASWFYEIMPDPQGASPGWQAGLYVRTVLDDRDKPAQPAIAIPASSLLVHQGRTLVYIEKRVGRYERREVQLLGRDGGTRYVAAEGWLASADRVVTSGAQVLLSEEFRNEADED